MLNKGTKHASLDGTTPLCECTGASEACHLLNVLDSAWGRGSAQRI